MADCKMIEKDLCNYCKRKTAKKSVQCPYCEKIYHNSCAARVLCCDKKLIVDKLENPIEHSEEEDIPSTQLPEDVLMENQVLKQCNKELCEQIVQLKQKINTLQKEKENCKTEIRELKFNLNSQQNKIDEKIIEFISNEIEKKVSGYREELNNVKMKVNNLEFINKRANTREQRNNEKQATDKQVPQKRTLYSSVTKRDNQETEKPITKQSKLNVLESKQREIMNNIIDLEPHNNMLNKFNSNPNSTRTNENVKRDEGETSCEVLEVNNSINNENDDSSKWQTVKSAKKYGSSKQNFKRTTKPRNSTKQIKSDQKTKLDIFIKF